MNQNVITVSTVRDSFSQWIDSVAQLAASLLRRVSSPTIVRLVEIEPGEFRLQSGEGAAVEPVAGRLRILNGEIDHKHTSIPSAAVAGNRVELVLQSDRFLFRPLELPNRATEFMAGIVRSQIDRLTPWTANDAAYGWSKPLEENSEKIVVTVAATAVSLIKPYVQAIANIGANSIAIFTGQPDDRSDESPIK